MNRKQKQLEHVEFTGFGKPEVLPRPVRGISHAKARKPTAKLKEG